MSRLSSEPSMQEKRYPADMWRERDMREWDRGGGWSGPSLLLTGVAAVGLGILAWHYIGADLQRYWKIHNM